MRIGGGNDKQGFPMKQGVLTNGRVRLLLKKGESCYRPRKVRPKIAKFEIFRNEHSKFWKKIGLPVKKMNFRKRGEHDEGLFFYIKIDS